MNAFYIDNFTLTVRDAETILKNIVNDMIEHNTVYTEEEILHYFNVINDYNKTLNEVIKNIMD